MSETDFNASDVRLIEEGVPEADSRAFRQCLGQYPTGVTIITARRGDKLLGMAVNSFAAVSLNPPLVLWSIRRESASAADFCEASHFAVNVLAADQVQVSQWFGSAHHERFDLVTWSPDPHGSPLLNGAIAHLECRRHTVLDGGDHFILVMHVERYARYRGEPLLFAQGQYAVTQSHPNVPTNRAGSSSTRGGEDEGPTLQRLLSITSQRMSAQFQKHREALGLTVSAARVLNRLGSGPYGVEELEQLTYLGHDDLEDALADLLAHGYVVKSQAALFELTSSGRDKNAAVAARAAAFTQDKLNGLPESDIAAAKRVLMALHDR